MPEGSFKYWDDPLKHYVRMYAWLPLCRNRLEIIRQIRYKKILTRRLRYFTFCATTAIDVLMLDIEKIIHPDASGRFSDVTFFEYSPEDVVETQKRIPGSNGFAGDFIETMLYLDLEEDDIPDDDDSLASPEMEEDKEETHHKLIVRDQYRSFRSYFPFDVLNFDLEEFLFKPSDPRPGKIVRALKKVFSWQQRPFRIEQSGAIQYINEFSLMFTTQIGPQNISDEYLSMLQHYLESNLANFKGLDETLTRRAGYANIEKLRNENFNLFFKLAMPKCLA